MEMNERIKELAEQANAWYPMGYPSGEGGDAAWKNLVIFEKEDLEKFAKLIVKECAELIDNKVTITAAQTYDELFVARYDTKELCAKQIKEHFGVKE
jgi:hypothetical protein